MQCEACRHASAVVVNANDNPTQPYQLCCECNIRLEDRALRPLEWFNLASVHGPNQFLLHDDFYDHDGTAYQPVLPVVNPESYPSPMLEDILADLPRLLDMSITQWFVADDVLTAISAHEHNVVLDSLIKRTQDSLNPWIESTCLRVCARVLGDTADSWVRDRYGKTPGLLYSWSEAAAACLPVDEAWRLTTDAISQSERIREDAQSLGWFRSPRTLDWIESQLPVLGLPVTEEWGRLAAVSEISWARVESWLSLGRPLSLVALDSMVACYHYSTLNLRRIQPKLATNVTESKMVDALERYAIADDVPRVTRIVASIKTNLATIIGAGL